MTSTATSSAPDSRPVEGHTSHLFSFSLGVVSGVNAMRRTFNRQTPSLDDLPVPLEGYSLAGGKLDTWAGDAFLSAGIHWFLLEAKRGYAEFADDLTKPRVKRLRELAQDKSKADLFKVAWHGHRFIYIGAAANSATKQPVLACSRYLSWLLEPDQLKREKLVKTNAQEFVTFLFDAGRTIRGFSWDELKNYIALMNKGGAVTEEDVDSRMAVAVDKGGQVNLCTYRSLELKLGLKAETDVAESLPITGGSVAKPGKGTGSPRL